MIRRDPPGRPSSFLKHVVVNNKVDATKAAVRVKLALRKMVLAEKAVAAAAGKKYAKEPKACKPKAKKPNAAKKVKKPAAEKPAAKKSVNEAAKKCMQRKGRGLNFQMYLV